MNKLTIARLAVGLCLSFTPLIANASTPIVRNLKQSQVSGDTANLQTINVWDGHGVSISFYQTGETIKRVWIDDPSQVLVDSDGCLLGIDTRCQNHGAGLIHLRRINRVNISGLPQTSSTHLTVITESPGGEKKSYHFRIVPSAGNPQYSQIAIVQDSPPPPEPQPHIPLQSLSTNFQSAKNVRAGVTVAIKNEWMKPSDELHQRLNSFVTYVTQGDEIEVAANKASVSMDLVNKLIQIGMKKDVGGSV
jgi:hypothetical protein